MNINELHEFRKQIDACIQIAEKGIDKDEAGYKIYGREMSLVKTKLQEAKMWVGKCLERLGSKLPTAFRDEAKK